LPAPDAESAARSERLVELMLAELRHSGGALAFDRFMELALYAPGLGYYTGGARKFGREGDFVTAPELSPLFGQCVARQAAEVLALSGGGDILELGAGSGRLAADVLETLEGLGRTPASYRIMELSAELRERQRALLAERVPRLLGRVQWLDRIPERPTRGLVLANEVVDAMPVSRFRIAAAGVEEQRVVEDGGRLSLAWGPAATPGLVAAVDRVRAEVGGLAEGYESEINLRCGPWVRMLAGHLAAGLILLLDYGYSRAEYYHPQRATGTLTCHYRHRAHFDPLFAVGLQDITANVDFTALAEAGHSAGLDVAGFATQGHFLLGAGLQEILGAADPNDVEGHIRRAQEVKMLTLPSAMGERFKVLGLGRGLPGPLKGFAVRDLRDRL
jgi:SAM-dependent MidA family methyltransferase